MTLPGPVFHKAVTLGTDQSIHNRIRVFIYNVQAIILGQARDLGTHLLITRVFIVSRKNTSFQLSSVYSLLSTFSVVYCQLSAV